MGTGPEDNEAIAPPAVFDAALAADVNAALIGELDEGLAIDPHVPFGDERRLFAALYLRHRYGIAQRAARYLRDPRDVDEVVQETFLRLFLALPDLENEAAAVAWSRRTATNLCIDRYRATQRRPSLIDLECVIDDLTDDTAVEDPLVQAEDAAIVRHALALLSPQHRDALIKREVEEKPLPQIAAEMGIPEESVKHLLYRARRALRRLLAGTSVEPGADLEGRSTAELLRDRARSGGKGAALLLVLAVMLSLPRIFAPSADQTSVELPNRALPIASPSLVSPPVTAAPSVAAAPPAESGDAPVRPPAVDPAEPGSADRTSDTSAGESATKPVAPPGASGAAPPAAPAAPVDSPALTSAPAGSANAAVAAPPAPPAETASSSDVARQDDAVAAAPAAAPAPVAAPAAPSSPANDGPSDLLTPRYALSGAPVLTSEGIIYDASVSTDSEGNTTSSSRYVAPTSDFDLSLNQTLIRRADGTTEFRFDPLFGIGGSPVDSVVASRDIVVLTQNDSSVLVVGTVQMAHSGPDPLPSRITITVRYSSDLARVVAQDVQLD